MSWAFQSATTVQSGTGTIAVNYPASLAVGNTVFLMCARGFGSGVNYTASDFQPLVSRNLNNSAALFYRVIDGSEGATSNVNGSSTSNSYCMARFTGGPSAADFPASIIATAATGTTGSGLTFPPLTIGAHPNALVMTLGTKQASISSFNTPSPFTNEIVHSLTSNAGQAFVWDYLIETTAADIVSGAWTLTGDASTTHQAIIAAISPAGAGAPFPPRRRMQTTHEPIYYPD
ncbi:MAG: hypothetical protein JWO52_7850 [Gammaproteobacteria bacterium]|nr:hypothetical protein [Gammaproteobacteria bacterium]